MGAMSSVPRIFVTEDLAAGGDIELPEGQSKYLTRVMRLAEGDSIRVFNGRHGEWRAVLHQTSSKRVSISPSDQTRDQVAGPELTLMFAPLKKARTDFVVEKACELGVRTIQTVMTEYTQASRVRADRLQSVVIEAAEQTERMDIPTVEDDLPLLTALDRWDGNAPVFYCDESGDALPMIDAVKEQGASSAAILIGPEGGFAPNERERLRSLPFVVPVTLGPRILRAETAAVAALTLWQSVLGDWAHHPYLPKTTIG